jgi:hypothetical protein
VRLVGRVWASVRPLRKGELVTSRDRRRRGVVRAVSGGGLRRLYLVAWADGEPSWHWRRELRPE